MVLIDFSLLHWPTESIRSKGKDHVPFTSQKASLTGLFQKFLFLSTTAISKPVFFGGWRYSDTSPYFYKGVSVPWLRLQWGKISSQNSSSLSLYALCFPSFFHFLVQNHLFCENLNNPIRSQYLNPNHMQ